MQLFDKLVTKVVSTLLLLSTFCSTEEEKKKEMMSENDPHSFANSEDVVVRHVHVDWDVNFTKQIISGFVILSVERLNPFINVLHLDSKDLQVLQVTHHPSGELLNYKIGEDTYVGNKFSVILPRDETFMDIKINYFTSRNASGLNWLSPDQTAEMRHPYLFSQFASIHGRSVIPLQDSSFVKFTFTATIHTPKVYTTLMSGLRDGVIENDFEKISRFRQPVPIQSYIMAIAVGELESIQIGPITRVWSEPSWVSRAAYEYAETKNMMDIGIDLCGDYVWGIYDILVLPPSFPYNGMENACLTFLNPTSIAGDRSLTNVVAHEISHAWFGNLLTFKNWQHFWLNEGFARFYERKILSKVLGLGRSYLDFEMIGGWNLLQISINSRGDDNELTKLILDLEDIHPDDSYSATPYEKGSIFLYYLEDVVGGPDVFEPFIRAYIQHFRFKTVETQQFVDYSKQYFMEAGLSENISEVDWYQWLNGTGMPPIKPHFDDTLAKPCSDLAERWVMSNNVSEFNISDLDALSLSKQKIVFLTSLLRLETPLTGDKFKALTETYKFNEYSNSDIKTHWIVLGLNAHYTPAIKEAVDMVSSSGKIKIVKPIYKALFIWDDSRQVAIETYERVRSTYMNPARSKVDRIIGYKEN